MEKPNYLDVHFYEHAMWIKCGKKFIALFIILDSGICVCCYFYIGEVQIKKISNAT